MSLSNEGISVDAYVFEYSAGKSWYFFTFFSSGGRWNRHLGSWKGCLYKRNTRQKLIAFFGYRIQSPDISVILCWKKWDKWIKNEISSSKFKEKKKRKKKLKVFSTYVRRILLMQESTSVHRNLFNASMFFKLINDNVASIIIQLNLQFNTNFKFRIS